MRDTQSHPVGMKSSFLPPPFLSTALVTRHGCLIAASLETKNRLSTQAGVGASGIIVFAVMFCLGPAVIF